MTETAKPDRPALPRDTFRDQRISTDAQTVLKPVIVTPEYNDHPTTGSPQSINARALDPTEPGKSGTTKTPTSTKRSARNAEKPFDAYGERTSSRPYALRLPDSIDLVLRQLAAEERTHPLRIIDRILHDHLKRIGRLPPPHGS
jgi:hypothetical protein